MAGRRRKADQSYVMISVVAERYRIRAENLAHVDITCDVDNVASQRTIVANGGVLVERFTPPAMCGHAEKLRYRVTID